MNLYNDHSDSLEELLLTVFNSISSGVFLVDNGIIIGTNTAVSTQLGYSPSEITNIPIKDLFFNAEEYTQLEESIRISQSIHTQPITLETVWKQSDRTFPVLLRAQSTDKDNRLITYTIDDYSKPVKLAYTDHLTGLFNRQFFDETLHKEVDIAQRQHTPLSLIFTDIRNFKTYNDSFGQYGGDQILKATADMLQKSIRSSDTLCRIGGDEFSIILRDNTPIYEGLPQRIENQFRENPIPYDDQEINISMSIGVVKYSPEDTPLSLFQKASIQLKNSKKSGQIEYYNQKE